MDDLDPTPTVAGEREDVADGTNTGPYGAGGYDNDDNWRIDSGTTHAREGTRPWGEVMAQMANPARAVISTTWSEPAGMAEMCGGNNSPSLSGNPTVCDDDVVHQNAARSAAARARPAS
jgi:hypothetical protein